ncbi:hypothetical protein [Micromonospora avicenniae]|uniref:hypothetical protein n=1 Tax=Micromonospora avicenniae TaxID=1198245 RepID=UPI003325A54C
MSVKQDKQDVASDEESPARSARFCRIADKAMGITFGTFIAILFGGALFMALLAHVAGYDSESLPDDISQYPDRIRGIALGISYILLAVTIVMVALLPPFVVSMAIQALDQRKARKADPQVLLGKRIARLNAALADSAELLTDLQSQLRIQEAARTKIMADIAKNEQIAQLHREQADAVASLVREVTDHAHTKLNRQTRREQLLFFMAGLLVSVPIGILVNFATSR